MTVVRSVVTRGFGENPSGGTPPTLPTISVANNDDGTATVTISGSNPAATNAVRVIRVDAQWTWAEWLDTGAQRTGDGDVIVPLTQGVYWFSVTSVSSGSEASSRPVYAWVSDGGNPALMEVLDAVVAQIRGLNLDGIASDQVLDMTAIDVTRIGELKQNTIIVGPLDQEGLAADMGTMSDYIEYPIMVAAAAPANRNHARSLRRQWYTWRERIRRRLITDGLQTATSIIVQTKYQPTRPYERRAWEQNGFISPLIFRFVSKEFRT